MWPGVLPAGATVPSVVRTTVESDEDDGGDDKSGVERFFGGAVSGGKDIAGKVWDATEDTRTGLRKGADDVAEEASDIGGFIERSVNFTDGEDFKRQWSDTAKTTDQVLTTDVDDFAKSTFDSFAKPIKESYKSGGVDEAVARGIPSGVAAVLGGKGLTKLGKLRPNGDRDSQGGDGDGGGDSAGSERGEGSPGPLTGDELAESQRYFDELPRKKTPDRTPADAYEREHTGDYNYTLRGGGEKVDADGYRVTDGGALEAKHVGNPARSPFRDDSSIPEPVREKILRQQDDEFRRYGQVVNDPSNPVRRVEVITNDPRAVPYFERLMDKYSIQGRVVVKP